MIIDTITLPDGADIIADIIIIGGGMAGITLARQWAGKTKTVAILESGGREMEDSTQDLYAGTGTLAVNGSPDTAINEYLTSSRARFYGGSGNWWGGKSVPLDPADFEERPWIKNSGWPMSRADLQPFYDRACDVLAIPHFDKDYAAPQHEGRPPLNINGSHRVTSLPRDYSRVTGRTDTDHFKSFIYDFTDSTNMSVYLHANVVDFNMNEGETAIDSLGVVGSDGQRFTARGTTYVLACGGIENARLLLAANQRNNARFGSRSGALGRYFQGHTTIDRRRESKEGATLLHFTNPPNSLSLYADRAPGAPHAVLGTTLEGQKHYQSGAFTVTLGIEGERGEADEQALRTTATRIDQAALKQGDDQECWCYFMAENLPNPKSRVTLSDAVDPYGIPRVNLRWEYGAADIDNLERSVDAFARELGSGGVGRVSYPIERSEIASSMGPSRHHMGTTRMHADPTVGVVDTDLKCHDASNLYVAGSSVFPTSGIANPTLTILALTLRLSDHLQETLGA